MLGWPADPARADCAFGHLTSGGTLANLQGLRLAMALKAFPVALHAAGVPLPGVPGDDWEAFNTGPAAATALFADWCAWRDALSPRERAAIAYARAATRSPLEFDDELRATLTRVFSPREVVILASTAAQVNYWARLIQALGIPPAGFSHQCAIG